MRIPRSLKIHKCNDCQAALEDGNFRRCGLSSTDKHFFFDYFCPACGFAGSYTFDIKKEMTDGEAVSKLAQALIDAESEADSKGNIKDQLNRIVGVQDLLDLGGKDAPKEKPRDDDSSNLP